MLFIAYNRDPSLPELDNDGSPITLANFGYWLGRFGHRVDMYVNRVIPKNNDSIYARKKYALQKKDNVKLYKNVQVIRKDVAAQVNNKLFIKEGLREIPEIIQSILFSDNFNVKSFLKYDAVCFFHPLSSFGILFRDLVNVDKTVLFPMLLSKEYSKFWDVSTTYKDLERISLIRVGKVLSTTRYEKEGLVLDGIDKHKIKIVPRGVDPKLFKGVYRNFLDYKKTLKLITIGAIRPQKRQEVLVDVVDKLTSKGLDVQLMVVGANKYFTRFSHRDYYEEILHSINKKGLDSKIIFTAGVSQPKVAEYLRRSDVAIFPSNAESFGQAQLEAITSGIPTILSEECEAIKDYGKDRVNSLFCSSNAEDLTEAVLELIKNPDLYSELSRNGTELIKKYNWEDVTRKLEKELKSLHT